MTKIKRGNLWEAISSNRNSHSPLIRLLDAASPEKKEQLTAWLDQGDSAARQKLKAELHAGNAIEEAHQRALEFAQQARVSLSCLGRQPGATSLGRPDRCLPFDGPFRVTDKTRKPTLDFRLANGENRALTTAI